MPNTDVNDRLQRIGERLTNVEGSSRLHNQRHENDSEMLSRVLDNLEHHTNNAHGWVSTIKQGGGITTALFLLGAFAELLRRFFL